MICSRKGQGLSINFIIIAIIAIAVLIVILFIFGGRAKIFAQSSITYCENEGEDLTKADCINNEEVWGYATSKETGEIIECCVGIGK